MKKTSGLKLVCILFLLGVPSCGPASDDEVVKQFGLRVEQYMKLHRSIESKLPLLPENASPEQIADHQQALAQAIRAARPGAQRGAIFSTAEEYFRRAIVAAMKGKEGEAAREAIKDGNPLDEDADEGAAEGAPEPVVIAVNAAYPPTAPLSTVPPKALLRLPPLPDVLNYRFVGPHLILHDPHANLIVDYVLNVVPST